jgi:signal transduction histidine kinase
VIELKSRKPTKNISASGRTLMTLLNNLLDLAKIEAGRMVLQPEAINLKLLLHDVVQMFATELRNKSVELRVISESTLPLAIYLDEIRIRQILTNLVGNAVKFTASGFIRITATHTTSESDKSKIDVILSIEDTGIGIAEENQSFIFESFKQNDDSTDSKYEGAGLSLTITKRLVELMNGEIKVQSKKNEGSTFTLRLPELIYLNEGEQNKSKVADQLKHIRFNDLHHLS